jgi:D-alanyl-D-alanine carboxypeptidase/D-alanyl-D-alanine-endopeptidase (penicillin-binding protein 4)
MFQRFSRALCGLFLPVLLFPGSSISSAQAQLPPAVQLVVDGHKLPAASYGLEVREIGAAEPLLSVNADAALNPASTIKTLTTLATLETLGPAYSWQTEVYALGPVVDGTLQGDLLLRGSGDPFMVEEQLRGLLKALRRNGVQHIAGNLVLDGSHFDPSVVEPENIDDEVGRAYNTEPHALLANFQTVTFYFYPHGNGRDVLIVTDPLLPNLRIDNRLRQREGACSGYQRGISFAYGAGNDSVVFSGNFPSRCGVYQLTREVLDPESYLYGLFVNLWQELGGTLEGTLLQGRVPDEVEPLLVWYSPPLADVITSVNKFSNNLMTRHLLLTLGAEQAGPPATVEKGIAAIHAWLDGYGIDRSTLHIVNGSGLARETRLSPAFLVDLLQHGYRGPWMPEFVSSLPINGLDGTMRSRLRDEKQRGRMHIKTGSLDGVAAVAGYVQARSGKLYTVAAILNHELADRGPGRELTDALLAWVVQQ